MTATERASLYINFNWAQILFFNLMTAVAETVGRLCHGVKATWCDTRSQHVPSLLIRRVRLTSNAQEAAHESDIDDASFSTLISPCTEDALVPMHCDHLR